MNESCPGIPVSEVASKYGNAPEMIPYVHTVEQSTHKPGDEQEKTVVTGLCRAMIIVHILFLEYEFNGTNRTNGPDCPLH